MKSYIVISYLDYSRLKDKTAFAYTYEKSKYTIKLRVVGDPWPAPGYGYVFVRGRYKCCIALPKDLQG